MPRLTRVSTLEPRLYRLRPCPLYRQSCGRTPSWLCRDWRVRDTYSQRVWVRSDSAAWMLCRASTDAGLDSRVALPSVVRDAGPTVEVRHVNRLAAGRGEQIAPGVVPTLREPYKG